MLLSGQHPHSLRMKFGMETSRAALWQQLYSIRPPASLLNQWIVLPSSVFEPNTLLNRGQNALCHSDFSSFAGLESCLTSALIGPGFSLLVSHCSSFS